MKKLHFRGIAPSLIRFAIMTGVTCLAITASRAPAQIVNNGFFNQNGDQFTGFGGYANAGFGDPANIPGFTDNNGSSGVEGYDIQDYNGGSTQGQYFAPPGSGPYTATSDPRDFAFLQNPGTTISQTVALSQLTNYTLTFLSGTRGGNPNATGTASIQIGSLTFSTTTAATAPNGFTAYSVNFTTGLNQSSALLTLANTTPSTVTDASIFGTDQTVDFADVVITATGRNGFVPEPSTYALLGLGAAGLSILVRRKVTLLIVKQDILNS